MASTLSLYGPLLIGGAVAFMLSGIVAVQCIIFFKLYPDESSVKTAVVALVWTLDVSQTAFILTSLLDYFVRHFGTKTYALVIPWSIALTILVTAMQTAVAHLFYAAKIYRASQRNWFITGPIVLLAFLRLSAAVGATIEMFRLKLWIDFLAGYPRFLFTAGLTLSACTDAIITLCLCHYLRKIRRLSSSSVMKSVFDTLTLYTLENGLITFLIAVGILLFWVFLRGSSIALAMHFILGKLYPNSLLVLLNTRKSLREMHSGDPGAHIDTAHHLAAYYTHFPHRAPPHLQLKSASPISPRAQDKSMSSATRSTPSPTYAYQPQIKMHNRPSPPPAAVPTQVQVNRTVTRTRQPVRDSVLSDAPSFDIDEAAAANIDRRRFVYPASFVSPPPSEGGRSLGNTSLHWRALP